MKKIDPMLYLVTDRSLCLGRELISIVEQAVQGGTTIVQLREKEFSGRDFYELTLEMKKMLSKYGVPLVINDRLDIALAAGVEGVHLGQNDIHPLHARRLLGEQAIVGLSVESMEQINEAENYDLDYIAISPVFSTPTKTDTIIEWGLDGLNKAKSVSRHTIIAIGGINKRNARQVIQAGADGIAVVSAICSSANPYQAARYLLSEFKS